MCGMIGGVSTIVAGVVLVALSSYVGYSVVPQVVENTIISEVVLTNESVQMERFKEIPFPLNFSVRIFNISNSKNVLEGSIPLMREIGPYVYKLYQRREIQNMDDDNIKYRRLDSFEFDAEASFPNREDDVVTIANVPYNAILQVTETLFPSLMSTINAALNRIFGEYNTPILNIRVRDLLFDGILICESPGLISGIACMQIREIARNARNLVEQENGSLRFSVLGYKNNVPSTEFVAGRGSGNPNDLGRIKSLDGASRLLYWSDLTGAGHESGRSVCNMINGTDSGIFAPFVDRNSPIHALNEDICRSVELRYQYETEYSGIPVARFSANEWFLDNHEGCFCLNMTRGVTPRHDCLLRGAMELYTCVGAFLVLTYPHYLYADSAYANGVLGMTPNEEAHKIFLELEPNTGTVVRGAKRAQFNIFLRPVRGIPATQNLPNKLTPIFWVDESVTLPEQYTDELKGRLLAQLNLVSVLVPVAIALCGVVLIVGLSLTIRARNIKTSSMAELHSDK